MANAANYLAKGSRNWLVTGLNRLTGYKGPLIVTGVEGGKQMMSAAEGFASLGTATTAGIGSVFRVLTALFFVGLGAVRYNGAATGAVATSELSLRLLENGLYNGTTYLAGLIQPAAPTITTKTAGPGFTGTKLGQGTHSLEIWRIRSPTGAISNASLPSNVVVTLAGETIVATFPLPSSNGDDRWGVASPKTGFADFGPFFEIRDVTEIPESDIATIELTDGEMTAADATLDSASATFTADDVGKEIIVAGAGALGADLLTTIASFTTAHKVELTDLAGTTVSGATVQYNGIVGGVLRSVELEWTDGQLAGMPLAPIDDFPPPAALFGGTLNDAGFLDGCYGDVGAGEEPATLGSTIAVSLPLKFESWPPDTLLYTPQPPTALSSRGSDGYAYRAGASSLGALYYTGGSPPIAFQLRWANDGCLTPNNMVIAEQGRLYIWTAQHGMARIGEGDEPDTVFAVPIWDEVKDWNAFNVVLGWDASIQHVAACHLKEIKPWNSQLERWGTLCDLTGKITGNIVAATTAPNGGLAPAGELYLCTLNGAANVSTTNASTTVTSPGIQFDDPGDIGRTVTLTEPSPGVGTLTTTILNIIQVEFTINNVTFIFQQITLAAAPTWTSASSTAMLFDATMRLYRFNAGNGMVSEAYTPWIQTEGQSDQVFGVGGMVVIDQNSNPVTLRLLANGDQTNVAREWQIYLPKEGPDYKQTLHTQQPNLINAQTHALYAKVIGTGGETSLDFLYTERESNETVIQG